MAKNDFVKYIFGNWEKFIILFITSLISLVGYVFMGGSFIQLQELTTQSLPPTFTDAGVGDGDMAIYIAFVKYIWDVLHIEISNQMVSLVHLVEKVHPIFLLLIVPMMFSIAIPLLIPYVVFLIVKSIFTYEPSTRMAPFLFPPFNVSTHFCVFCKEEGNGSVIDNWIKYPIFWILAAIKTIFILIINFIVLGFITGGGAAYILWFLLIRPLHQSPDGKFNIFNYREILAILLDYSNTLLFMCSIIYFMAGVLYLGQPLQITVTLVFIFSVLWLFFEYLKMWYAKKE
jgi:hypothetical protein